jgi:hypothetical protein
MDQLKEQLRLGQIPQPELTQLLQPEPAAQTARHQIPRRLGEQHLPAMAGGPHPGTTIDRCVVDMIPARTRTSPVCNPIRTRKALPAGHTSPFSRS